MTEKESLIRDHYKNTHNCCKCFDSPCCRIKADPLKVQRKILPEALNSEIFLIGQALAEKTQRLSGVPYTFPTGQLSSTGNRLEKFLNKMEYTLLPNTKRQLVYSSDIVDCFPGKNAAGRGDLAPTDKEIENCHGWLTKELQIIQPRIILLLGRPSTKTFWKVYRNMKVDKLDPLLKKEHKIQVGKLLLSTFVLPHPASMYPGLQSVYDSTIDLIKRSI